MVFGRAVAPLTSHCVAGEATPVLTSMRRSWATGSVPGARPAPDPPAARAARHWRTVVPTWVGENTVRHCQPSRGTRHTGRAGHPHPPLRQSGKRRHSHEHTGAGGEEEEVVKICLQSYPCEGNLFRGHILLQASLGCFGVPTALVRYSPSLCSHGVSLEVLEAGVEVQQPTCRSHTCGEEGSRVLMGLGIPGHCRSCIPAQSLQQMGHDQKTKHRVIWL